MDTRNSKHDYNLIKTGQTNITAHLLGIQFEGETRMMEAPDLKQLASLVGEWSEAFPNVKTVYIFGSRVRGDHRTESDLDIGLEIDFSTASADSDAHSAEHGADYEQLKKMMPPGIIAHIHLRMDEPAWPSIIAGKCIHQTGKVRCVITPAKTKRT